MRIKPFYYLDALYYCSDLGNIYNSKMVEKETKPNPYRDGYLTVVLYGKDKNGKKHSVGKSVHRIVAELFVPRPSNEPNLEVNHIDCDRTNPHYTNLEWITHYENIQYSIKKGRHKSPNWSGINNPKSKLSQEQKQEIINLYKTGMTPRQIYKNKRFPVSETRIQQIVREYRESQTTIRKE